MRYTLGPKDVLVGSLLLIVFGLGAASVANAQRTNAVSRGEWGGPGIAMTVDSNAVTVEFDCATGQIDRQLRAKRNGTFEATGTFTPNGPGPIRIDRQPSERRVIFRGKVSGKKMTLTLIDSNKGDVISTFTLTKGGSARLHRCL
jgi:hypothetical protein